MKAGPMVSLWDLSSFRQSPAARAYRGVKRPPHSCTIPQTPGLGLVVTGRCEGLDRHTQELEAAQMSQS